MLKEDQKKEIETIVKEFFDKTTLTKNPEIKIFFPLIQEMSEEIENIDLDVIVEDPQILIGQRGETLKEIQKILRILLSKKLQTKFYINLDINGYKRKKNERLEFLVQETANKVVSERREISLQPMSAYDRRIIHTFVSKRSDVEAESRGEEPTRYVVIKPKNAF